MKALIIRKTSIDIGMVSVRTVSIALAGVLMYTATKKLMDTAAFAAHLELLPYIGKTAANILTLGVMLVEYALGFIILYRPQDTRGYLIIASLMLIYTGYVYYILEHAAFLPCSCQGAFKTLSWEMHYVVNAVMVLLAMSAWAILKRRKYKMRTL